MLEKESRSQHAAGEKALIYIRQVLFWRGNTLKKTKGPCCAHLFQNSVALAFGSLGYLNIYWNSPRKGGNLINTTLWFYNILECFFPGRIFHFSTFEKKKSLSFTVHYKQQTSQPISCQRCWCAAVYNTIKVNGREQNTIQLL